LANQDTLPRGGFGNLIAPPLQHGPRQEGNTVFLDDQLVPYPDQWAFLISVTRVDPTTVDRIAREPTRTGQVVGVRWSETSNDDDDATPWDRPPSRQPPTGRLTGPLPKVVRSVLAQRLFVEKVGLASPHLEPDQAPRISPITWLCPAGVVRSWRRCFVGRASD
jgi:hypothetical protein